MRIEYVYHLTDEERQDMDFVLAVIFLALELLLVVLVLISKIFTVEAALAIYSIMVLLAFNVPVVVFIWRVLRKRRRGSN